ncbi:MAG TPA: transglycosylase domain-containing protein [Candidatus Ozemobacteraceae bacterium]|nr:transglycosylase domain-containing protein [Candidatus Ozemobacteraceae bacterium]
MKRWLKRVLLVMVVVTLGFAGYQAFEVYAARAHTVEKVIPMLANPNLKLSKTDLTARQLEILLKVEDPAFYSHNGVDLTTPGAGITTITQGLVKLLYFDKFKPGIAKIKQSLIAIFALNALVSKDDQLKLFLNLAWFGVNDNQTPILGFGQAAQAFFGRDLPQLSEDEFIALVGTLVAPAIFSPLKHNGQSAERVARIRKLLSGDYQPKGLFDIYYGKIPAEFQKDLAPASYFESTYE